MSLPFLSNPNFGFGSRVLSFTSGNASGVSFVAQEYDPSEPTSQTTRTTELGAPNGVIIFEERRTLRAQLQFANVSTPTPDRGDTLSVTRRTISSNTTTTVNYAVTEVGLPERPRDFWVCDFQAVEAK